LETVVHGKCFYFHIYQGKDASYLMKCRSGILYKVCSEPTSMKMVYASN